MSEILCVYYSRTGNTKKAMEEIAQALDAELLELKDEVKREEIGRASCRERVFRAV